MDMRSRKELVKVLSENGSGCGTREQSLKTEDGGKWTKVQKTSNQQVIVKRLRRNLGYAHS